MQLTQVTGLEYRALCPLLATHCQTRRLFLKRDYQQHVNIPKSLFQNTSPLLWQAADATPPYKRDHSPVTQVSSKDDVLFVIYIYLSIDVCVSISYRRASLSALACGAYRAIQTTWVRFCCGAASTSQPPPPSAAQSSSVSSRPSSSPLCSPKSPAFQFSRKSGSSGGAPIPSTSSTSRILQC
jgi:hypothetical protein